MLSQANSGLGTLQKPELAVDLRMRAGASRLHLMGDAYPRLSRQSRSEPGSAAVEWCSAVADVPWTNRDDHRATDGDRAVVLPLLQLQLQQGAIRSWPLGPEGGLVRGIVAAGLDRFNSPLLEGSGQLPLSLGTTGLETGELQAGLNLKALAGPLQRPGRCPWGERSRPGDVFRGRWTCCPIWLWN